MVDYDKYFILIALVVIIGIVLCVKVIISAEQKHKRLSEKYGCATVECWSFNQFSGIKFKEVQTKQSKGFVTDNIKALTFYEEDKVAILESCDGRRICLTTCVSDVIVNEMNKKIDNYKAGKIVIEPSNYIPPSKKDASVVGRAVVGGIIAGPAGAVVGALSAVDKNNKNRE